MIWKATSAGERRRIGDLYGRIKSIKLPLQLLLPRLSIPISVHSLPHYTILCYTILNRFPFARSWRVDFFASSAIFSCLLYSVMSMWYRREAQIFFCGRKFLSVLAEIILELMKLIFSFYSYMVFGYLLKNGRNTITSSYSITIFLIELPFSK